MAKVKVNSFFSIIGDLQKLTKDKARAEVAGASVEAFMRDHIKKGLSPVKGVGRFKQYAKIRTHPSKYPDGIAGKRVNPVNLKLTGKMLDKLTHWVKRKRFAMTFVIGLNPNTSKEIVERAETHNEGTLEGKNVPQRKFVPNRKGDRFTITIERQIKKLLSAYIQDKVRLSNKK